MKLFRLVECTDNDYDYGILVVNTDISTEQLQDKINKAKNSFEDDNWIIEDVIDWLNENGVDCYQNPVASVEI